jgi:hypothetical protein|uniref:Fringe-like glycosyltransferase domain-containing protein n=1 Tax=Castor canadensis TaxID=51338 RepID=A0A8C0ZUJ6_CASCN
MQCRLLRGLTGALLTLLCMGLLSLRYHSSLSPQGVQETPRLSQPSPQPGELSLHDVFIAVKTTLAFHRSRLDLLLHTWVSRTRQQVTSRPLWGLGVAPGGGAHRVLSGGLGSLDWAASPQALGSVLPWL